MEKINILFQSFQANTCSILCTQIIDIDFSDITVNVDIFDVDLLSQAVNSRKLNSRKMLTTCILYCTCSFSPN